MSRTRCFAVGGVSALVVGLLAMSTVGAAPPWKTQELSLDAGPGSVVDATVIDPDHTIARIWNETLLDAIRMDRPKPPVHSRNLFHLSVAMWDAWAAYDPVAIGYITREKHHPADVHAARREAISYAAYRLLMYRFPGGGIDPDGQPCQPGAEVSQADFTAKMNAMGYDPTFTSTMGDTPAALGNRIGQAVIDFGRSDGATEGDDLCYPDPSGYHAVTQGFLQGEIVRRVTGRSIGTFFRDEVAGPLGADFHIGLDPKHDARVGELVPPEMGPGDAMGDPDSIGARTMRSCAITGHEPRTEAWRRAEIPAAGGIGNARSIARIHSAMACGGEVDGVRILSEAGALRALEEQTNGVLVAVTEAELAELDWRERDYERTDISDRITLDDASGSLDGPIVTYVPRASAVERYERARDDGRAAIRQSYWDLVHAAFGDLGGDHLDRFLLTPSPDVPVADITLAPLPK